MSATSGITVSPELSTAFSDALTSQSVRFLKISIRNESLVVDQTVPPAGTLDDDLDKLGDILEDNVPAYVLTRLDNPPTEWLAINYVPDSAKVRDKMLYASTRNNLTKALGSAPFTDSLFATSKADISAAAYKKHVASLAAPKPMTAREKEMEEIKAAESRSAAAFDGSRARRSHVGGKVGFQWTEETERAVKELGASEQQKLVVLSIDPASETLVLSSEAEVDVNSLGSALPAADPVYAFFAWPQGSRRDIVFIYSCPSGSPIKHRMLYSSGMLLVFHHAKSLVEPRATLVTRKVETSDPGELNEHFLRSVLGPNLDSLSPHGSGASTPAQEDQKPLFARPKGPPRRR